VRERFVSDRAPVRIRKPAGFWRGAAHALRNRGMLVLMTLILLGQISSMFTSGLDYYVLVYHVCGGDIVQGAFWKGMLSTSFSIVGVAAVWAVAWLSKRLDKRNTLTGIYALVVVGGVGKWFFFREDMPWLCLLTPLLCAPIFTANGMIAQSMLADLCDEDEWRHRERREGLFGAVHSWAGKLGASLSILGAGVALNLVGFDAAREASQAPEALLGMRYLIVLATSIPALMAIFVLRCYPLDQRRMAEIRTDLEARRGAV
jgi:GPH family glycoside/pentoside/hexuronide:cation symporter